MSRVVLSSLVAASVVALASWPLDAQACGGMFCDAGLPGMPVDQAGEDVLFVQDGDEIEVHIRIAYDSEAEQFAWLVPVPAVPTVGVGSAELFGGLERATQPRYWLDPKYEYGCEGGAGASGFASAGDVPGYDPDVLDEGVAGAFEYVVLDGGNAEELVGWLDANGYEPDEEATPIVQEYIAEGYMFLAFKLAADAAQEEIHPVVLRYEGNRPCIPLRLTRIAAVDDMAVHVYGLGEVRLLPVDYDHVVVNEVHIQWEDPTRNYDEVLSLAIDEAGGKAFTTDYAGDSSIVNLNDSVFNWWDADAFVGLEPHEAVGMFNKQRLIQCHGVDSCIALHAQAFPLLRKYIPAPPGVDEAEFWSNMTDYVDEWNWAAYDDVALSYDIAERIVEPAIHVRNLLDDWPVLTRMTTLISPHEMTRDPMFMFRGGIGPVDNINRGIRLDYCDGRQRYEFPNGARMCLPPEADWPTFDLPYARRIETLPMAGAPQVHVDNSDLIQEAIDAHNEVVCESGEDDEDDDDGGGGPSDESGGSGTDGGDAAAADPTFTRGCGCTADDDSDRGLPGLLLLGLAFAARRRRD